MAPDRLRAAAAASKGGVSAAVKKRASVLEVRKRPAGTDASGVGEKRARRAGGLEGCKTEEELTAEAEARVAADMRRLLGGAGRFGSEAFDEREEEEDAGAEVETAVVETTFVAPAGQSGDGRTSLNDKFGY